MEMQTVAKGIDFSGRQVSTMKVAYDGMHGDNICKNMYVQTIQNRLVS